MLMTVPDHSGDRVPSLVQSRAVFYDLSGILQSNDVLQPSLTDFPSFIITQRRKQEIERLWLCRLSADAKDIKALAGRIARHF